jgi:hypothetical protein
MESAYPYCLVEFLEVQAFVIVHVHYVKNIADILFLDDNMQIFKRGFQIVFVDQPKCRFRTWTNYRTSSEVIRRF